MTLVEMFQIVWSQSIGAWGIGYACGFIVCNTLNAMHRKGLD